MNEELRKFRIRNSEFRESLIAMEEDEKIKNEEVVFYYLINIFRLGNLQCGEWRLGLFLKILEVWTL